MKARKPRNKIQGQRRGLLAKVHIAKKDLCLLDVDYRDILKREFGVTTARALTVGELESLVKRFKDKGWQPKTTAKVNPDQAEALREKVMAVTAGAEFDARHPGPHGAG